MNERTSKKIAKIASKVLKANVDSRAIIYQVGLEGVNIVMMPMDCTGAELKSLAASALTQAPDVKK